MPLLNPSVPPFQRVLAIPGLEATTTEVIFGTSVQLLDSAEAEQLAFPAAPQIIAVGKTSAGSQTTEIQLPPGNWLIADAFFVGSAVAGAGDTVEFGLGEVGTAAIATSFYTFDLDALTSVDGTISRVDAWSNGPTSVDTLGPVFDSATESWLPRQGGQCLTVIFTEAVDAQGTLFVTLAKAA